MWPPAKVNPPPESARKPLFESHSKYTKHGLKQITTAMRLFYCQHTISRHIWAPERLLTTTTKSALLQPKNNQHGNRQLVYSPTTKPQASYMIKTSIQRQHAEGWAVDIEQLCTNPLQLTCLQQTGFACNTGRRPPLATNSGHARTIWFRRPSAILTTMHRYCIWQILHILKCMGSLTGVKCLAKKNLTINHLQL